MERETPRDEVEAGERATGGEPPVDEHLEAAYEEAFSAASQGDDEDEADAAFAAWLRRMEEDLEEQRWALADALGGEW